jgi:hypothetical protein
MVLQHLVVRLARELTSGSVRISTPEDVVVIRERREKDTQEEAGSYFVVLVGIVLPR